MPHIKKIKLKKGTAHIVHYSRNGKRSHKYFPAPIPYNIVKAWAKDLDRKLAYEKAGLTKYQEQQVNLTITLLSFKEHFIQDRQNIIKDKSLQRYLIAWNNLCNIIDPFTPISSLDKSDIKQFINTRLDKGKSKSGINRDLSHINIMLNFALKNKFISENPMEDIKLLRVPEKEMIVLTDDEIEKYFNCLDDEYDLKLAFKIIQYTGCRRRSIAVRDWQDVLQWKDIDFDNDTIVLTQKGGHRKRFPLHIELKEILLKRYIELGQPSGNVINLHADTITQKFRKAFNRTGIKKDIKPVHGLRHRAATKLLECGIDLKTVSEILGHTTTKTTEIYAHPSMAYKRESINKL